MAQNSLCVLLDDDQLILASWALAAREAGVPLEKFSQSEDLMAHLSKFPADTTFFLDARLANGEKGEEVARKLYEFGYQELHLVTGYPPSEFASCYWLKSVRDKDPPWKK